MKKGLMVFALVSIFLSQATFGAVSKSQAPLVSLFQKGSFRTVSKLDDTCAVRMVAFVKNDGKTISGIKGAEATGYLCQTLWNALSNNSNAIVIRGSIDSEDKVSQILEKIQSLAKRHDARFFSGLVDYRHNNLLVDDTPLSEMQLAECGDLLKAMESFFPKDLAKMRRDADIDSVFLGGAFLIGTAAVLYCVTLAGVVWMAYYIDSLHLPLAL